MLATLIGWKRSHLIRLVFFGIVSRKTYVHLKKEIAEAVFINVVRDKELFVKRVAPPKDRILLNWSWRCFPGRSRRVVVVEDC